MKNSVSDVKDETLKSFKKARKKAKAAFKSKFKEFKSMLKPYKQALKDAEKAEKAAKAAMRALADKVQDGFESFFSSDTPAPKKRGRQPGTSPKAAKAPKAKPGRKLAAPKVTKTATKGGDDLTQVKGVGENIAEMLKANGVRTFADMAATSFDRYKELLKANGMSKFRDPSQWAARAAVLADMPAPTAEPAAPKKQGRKPATSTKRGKKVVVNHEEQKAPKAKAAAKPTATKGKGDDLTQVKGVGENIAEMLKANGVRTFADMAATSFDRYKELLKANGMSKFRDPSQWAARAAVLAEMPAAPAEAPKKRGRQPGFSPKGKSGKKASTKTVASEPVVPKKQGRQPGTTAKAAKAAAVPKAAPAKPKGAPAKQDDLTQVKGVGQRVADALNSEGIYTFKEMAAVSLERYKEILKANNMSKFRDPSGWAGIAAELAGKK